MTERSIEDPKQGIRVFYAYERERLQTLGFLNPAEVEGKQGVVKTMTQAA